MVACRLDCPPAGRPACPTEPRGETMARERRRLLISPPRLAQRIALTAAERHYLTRVLRLAEGQGCDVVDGAGRRWSARLVGDGMVELEQPLAAPLEAPAPSLPPLELAVAVPRQDVEVIWRMATELGIDRLQPLLAERCQGRERWPVERWRSILREATEQCERLWLPELAEPLAAAAWLAEPAAGVSLLATSRGDQLPLLPQVLQGLTPQGAAPAPPGCDPTPTGPVSAPPGSDSALLGHAAELPSEGSGASGRAPAPSGAAARPLGHAAELVSEGSGASGRALGPSGAAAGHLGNGVELPSEGSGSSGRALGPSGAAAGPLAPAKPGASGYSWRVRLAIGPEGGWSPAEEEAARAAGWIAVSAGPTILRTATAAVAAAAVLTLWRASLSSSSSPWQSP